MIIIRYGEIGLKRKLRRKFENLLINNIKNTLKNQGFKVKISTEWGRIYIHSSDESIARISAGVFGVTSTSVAIETSTEIEDIKNKAVEIGERLIGSGKSFAVRARRTGKHDFTSMDVQRIVGAELKKKTGSKVNLSAPDVKIYIEVRDNRSFIYTSFIRGFGGLPVGSQERVLSIVNDGKSILSSWYALRRGCEIDLLISGDYNEFREILFPWAGYRDIEVIKSSGDLKKLLNDAFELDYRGVYCSASFEEINSLISDSLLRNRKMPVFFPLMPFNGGYIEEKIKIVRSYFKTKSRIGGT
ncbi:MAG TPA: hypothetical protein EYP30_04900 [Archaeoglobaceae archaeon]|nr:hypothetical protein [Archaeoglobaceae archaeon]